MIAGIHLEVSRNSSGARSGRCGRNRSASRYTAPGHRRSNGFPLSNPKRIERFSRKQFLPAFHGPPRQPRSEPLLSWELDTERRRRRRGMPARKNKMRARKPDRLRLRMKRYEIAPLQTPRLPQRFSNTSLPRESPAPVSVSVSHPIVNKSFIRNSSNRRSTNRVKKFQSLYRIRSNA